MRHGYYLPGVGRRGDEAFARHAQGVFEALVDGLSGDFNRFDGASAFEASDGRTVVRVTVSNFFHDGRPTVHDVEGFASSRLKGTR